jgi:membrane protein insertase Oxa1/YidC/SpoIIIJ
MTLWMTLVDALRALLFAVAHLTGGSFGVAILIVSTLIRLAMLPLTLRMARQMRERKSTLRTLPAAGIMAITFGALYSAISGSVKRIGGFLWIRDLGAPDIIIAGVAAALTALTARADATTGAQSRSAFIGAAFTLWIAWRLTSGVGLYWVASNAVGLGQSLVLRRERQKA